MGGWATRSFSIRSSDVTTLGTEFGLSEHEQLELRKQLVRLLAEIEQEPRIGRPMRRRHGYEALADCHSLTFDLPGWRRKHRFRIVYKIDPSVEAVGRILVYAVGSRPDLDAYQRARARRRVGHRP